MDSETNNESGSQRDELNIEELLSIEYEDQSESESKVKVLKSRAKRSAKENPNVDNKRIKTESSDDQKPMVHHSIHSMFNPNVRESVQNFIDSYIKLQNKADNLTSQLTKANESKSTISKEDVKKNVDHLNNKIKGLEKKLAISKSNEDSLRSKTKNLTQKLKVKNEQTWAKYAKSVLG